MQNEELDRLREENKKLKSLLNERQDLRLADAVPSLISYMDTKLRYTFVNKAYERWFNVSCEDLIGVPVRDLVGEIVFTRALPHFQKALRGEIVEFDQESPYPSGTKHIHVTYTPDKDPITGEIRGIIALVNDISDRKKVEKLQEELIEKSKAEVSRLTSLFEEAPMAMALLEGPEHRFAYANHVYRQKFLKTPFLNKTVGDVLPEAKEQGFLEILDRVFSTGIDFKGSETLFRLPLSNGENKDHYLDFIYKAIKDSQGKITGILAVITDVTEQVEAKNKLIEQIDIRERFVSTLTHDLTTPLTAARLSTQLIQRKSSDSSIQTLSTRTLQSLTRVESMVRDLLDANKINAGEGVPISVKDCELNLLVEEAMLDLLSLHGNRIIFSKNESFIHGKWDAKAIVRVIENLVNNAVKYGHTQTPITISTAVIEHKAELTVHNHGPAISPEDQKTLFNSYRRLTSAIASGKSGWGIGLSLVKALVDAHAGSIGVRSDDQFGTSFTIRLPIR